MLEADAVLLSAHSAKLDARISLWEACSTKTCYVKPGEAVVGISLTHSKTAFRTATTLIKAVVR